MFSMLLYLCVLTWVLSLKYSVISSFICSPCVHRKLQLLKPDLTCCYSVMYLKTLLFGWKISLQIWCCSASVFNSHFFVPNTHWQIILLLYSKNDSVFVFFFLLQQKYLDFFGVKTIDDKIFYFLFSMRFRKNCCCFNNQLKLIFKILHPENLANLTSFYFYYC